VTESTPEPPALVDLVVLLHRDDPLVVRRGLRALAVSMRAEWAGRLVLVMNAAPAATALAATSEVSRLFPNAHVVTVTSARNRGFAAGVNLGVAQATAPLVGLFNPDGVTRPETVVRLVHALDHDTAAFMAGAQQVSTPVTEPPPATTPSITDWLPGTAVVFRRKWFLEAGGFDPGYFMYCEDVDLSRRARARGWHLLSVPDAVFLHARGFGRAESLRRIRMWTVSNTKLVYQYGDPRRAAMARLARQRAEWFRNLARQRRWWTLAGAVMGSIELPLSIPRLERRRRHPWDGPALRDWLVRECEHVRVEEAAPVMSGGARQR
jgi:GT2 family glycosyltransferase